MSRELARELRETLDEWKDECVAVRVVAATDELIAVFCGTLVARSKEKRPSLFWPVEVGEAPPGLLERPGIYAHPAELEDVRVHVGGFVVEFTQAGVTVNVRRLESSGA
jgi:hypothetical protein